MHDSRLIDTHAHLALSQFSTDADDVLARAWGAGLESVVVIGSGEGVAGNHGALDFIKRDDRLFAAVGVHPQDADAFDHAWMDDVQNLLQNNRVVAVGEIGLDYHYKTPFRDIQIRCLQSMLHLAYESNKPIIIHDRDAHDDVWNVIESEGVPKSGGVFHCFSGDTVFANKIIDAGFYISIPGVITFKNAEVLKDVVESVPIEKMVLETDSPYLAPVPHRGKRNEPSFVRRTAEAIAAIKGMSIDDVARITTLNAKRLFGLLDEKDVDPEIAYVIRNSLYLNITNDCNLACRFCPKFKDKNFEVKGHYLKLSSEPSVNEIIIAAGDVSKYDEVVFCGYGEPTKRLNIVKGVAARLKKLGVKKVRLNTDGLANLLYGRNILPELQGLIDSISISMNAADADFYAKICPSKFGKKAYDAMCDFAAKAKNYIPEVVVSVVTVPSLDVDACRAKAHEIGVPIRVREYMKVG